MPPWRRWPRGPSYGMGWSGSCEGVPERSSCWATTRSSKGCRAAGFRSTSSSPARDCASSPRWTARSSWTARAYASCAPPPSCCPTHRSRPTSPALDTAPLRGAVSSAGLVGLDRWVGQQLGGGAQDAYALAVQDDRAVHLGELAQSRAGELDVERKPAARHPFDDLVVAQHDERSGTPSQDPLQPIP